MAKNNFDTQDQRKLNNETKFSYLTKKLPRGKREELIEELNISQKTLYNWLKHPKKISISAFALIQTYIEIEYGKCYYIEDLLTPIEV